MVLLQWIFPLNNNKDKFDIMRKYQGLGEYSILPEIYGWTMGVTYYTPNTLEWVDPAMPNVINGNLTRKIELGVELELYMYCTAHVHASVQDTHNNNGGK